MILDSFDYKQPQSLAEAVKLYSAGDAMYLSGGTDLIVELTKEKYKPACVIDLKYIVPSLRYIRLSDDGKCLHIGALTTFRDLEKSELVQRYAPGLAEAASLVGSTPVRARGTVGGNVCHSIPSADTVPPLLTMDAVFKTYGPTGAHEYAGTAFFTGPGKNVMAPGEILHEICVPVLEGDWRMCYYKLMRRKALDLSQLGVAVTVCVDNGAVADCRIALGTAAPVPMRAANAEKYLVGKKLPLSEEEVQELGDHVCCDSKVRTSRRATKEYRHEILHAFVRKAAVRMDLTEKGEE